MPDLQCAHWMEVIPKIYIIPSQKHVCVFYKTPLKSESYWAKTEYKGGDNINLCKSMLVNVNLSF